MKFKLGENVAVNSGPYINAFGTVAKVQTDIMAAFPYIVKLVTGETIQCYEFELKNLLEYNNEWSEAIEERLRVGVSHILIEKEDFELAIDYDRDEDRNDKGLQQDGELFSIEMGTGFGSGNSVNIVIANVKLSEIKAIRDRLNEVIEQYTI